MGKEVGHKTQKNKAIIGTEETGDNRGEREKRLASSLSESKSLSNNSKSDSANGW